MNVYISALLIASSLFGLVSLKTPKVRTKDLQTLTGAKWAGSLSYLDYRKNQKVSIPSTLTVTQSVEDKSSWMFEYQYPDEPKANSKEIVTLSKDGKFINAEMVIERTNLPGDVLKIVTEKNGSDNDKKALFRFTYLLSKTSLSIKKEVKYEDATGFFVRNEYSWKR